MQTSDEYQVLPIYMQTSFSLKNGQTCRLIALVGTAVYSFFNPCQGQFKNVGFRQKEM